MQGVRVLNAIKRKPINWERIGLAVWFLAICIITAGSLAPSASLPDFSANDKGLHFITYLILSILPALTYGWTKKGVLACLTMVVLGLGLEFGQLYVPGRSFETSDILANGLGVLIGLVSGIIVRRLHDSLN